MIKSDGLVALDRMGVSPDSSSFEPSDNLPHSDKFRRHAISYQLIAPEQALSQSQDIVFN